ncbi:MAG: sodium/proline symporter [bacterium]
MIATSFLCFLGLFVFIGVLSRRYAKPTRRSYLLAGQDVKPWLVGLSAVATNNSGYMFIGVIGYTYMTGLPAIWLMIGWILGDLIASSVVHRRLREASTSAAGNTFPAILASWHGQQFKAVRVIGGLITVVFLGTYAAAQLTAGSKALHVLFGWSESTGAIIGAAMVLAYCLAGGIRASIWTDAAQSIVMIAAMTLILVVGVASLGGPGTTWQQLNDVSPTYMSLFPQGLALGDTYGPLLFVVGWLFAGFSVVGQPHIMVRFMALDHARNINRARLYYYLWFVAFYFIANAVALISRLLIPDAGGFDPELALPTIAVNLLPPVMVGLVLAGIFAATMSTADSLILSCAGSVSEDIIELPHKVWITKASTIAVCLFALWLALSSERSVFDLVVASWAVLAACFGPLLTIYALNQRPTQALALTMMFTGLISVYVWLQFDVLADYYEGMLAICLGFVVFLIGRATGFVQDNSAASTSADDIAEAASG